MYLSIISLCLSGCAFVLPLIINHRYRTKDKLDSLDNRLDSIIQIGIEYPYLEDKHFARRWCENKDNPDDRYMRYDNYCNIVFNFLHSVCEFYNYDRKKIEDYIDIRDWVRTHKDNWQNPVDEYENVDGYDDKFKKFIDSYIN